MTFQPAVVDGEVARMPVSPLEPPAAVIGGVATLHDAIECGGLSALPTWPSEALERRREALRAATDTSALLIRSMPHDDAGGWIPAEPAAPAARGFRIGSSQWRRASADEFQRAAAEQALNEERRRSGRFFLKAAADADAERAREAEHWRVHVHQACRAVDRRRLNSACTARPHLISADAAQRQEEEVKEHSQHPPQRPAVALGYRPGSAAARRAAGGLYATSEGHSRRLVDAVSAQTLEQERAAQRAVNARLEARSNEDVAADEALARREMGATRALNTRSFGAHAERVAVRRTMHLGLNMALAPQQRLHCQRPGSFDPGHMAACW